MGADDPRGAVSNYCYQLANILRVDANVSDTFFLYSMDPELDVRNRASMEVELVRVHVKTLFSFAQPAMVDPQS